MAFNSEAYIWADDTPQNCPPDHAKPSVGRYYRAVKNIPPENSDFMRWIDEPHNFGKTRSCAACGVSVFSSIEGVVNMIKRFPNRWGKFPNHGVMQGDLEEIIGVISQEGKNLEHYNIWVQEGVELRDYFIHTVEI